MNALCNLTPIENWTTSRLETLDLSFNEIDNDAVRNFLTIVKSKWLYNIKDLNLANNNISKLPASVGSLSKLHVS